jgi:hypothetical protein
LQRFLRARSRVSIRDLQDQDRLTIALKTAIRNGADINSLSEASGLTPAEIVRRIDSELIVLSDLELIAGLV